jgi:DNA-binding NarL/FixJ family response regulator
MARVRVLLAEDHEAVAAELRALLESECDVLATVRDGQSMVAAAALLNPEVIVTDISMPILDGLSAAEALRRAGSSGRIVFVTVHDEPAMVERGFRVGGLGYVLKPAAGEDLLPAVRAAVRGERFVSPMLLPETSAGGTSV